MIEKSSKDDLPDDLRALGKRLKDSDKSLDSKGFAQSRLNPKQGSALGLALRVSVELVSALAVGLVIGWLLDQWLDTRPWIMLVFLLLGGSAGILNVYRMAKGMGYADGYGEKTPKNDTEENGTEEDAGNGN